jgi:hypothetical protein
LKNHWGVKLTSSSPSNIEVKNVRSFSSTSPYVFMLWCLNINRTLPFALYMDCYMLAVDEVRVESIFACKNWTRPLRNALLFRKSG